MSWFRVNSSMYRPGRMRRAIALGVLFFPAVIGAQAPGASGSREHSAAAPLPELNAFLAEVRRHIRPETIAQTQFACVQRETEVKLDGDGNPTETETRVYEIYPPTPGASGPYRRLVSRNGVNVPESELAEKDRRRQAEIEERMRQFRRESPEERERRLRREAKERDEHQAVVDDAFRTLDLRMAGREWLAGRPSIVLTFVGRPQSRPTTRFGSVMQKLKGRIWVDEQDFEIVKVEGRAAEDITYGFGLFARIHEGTTASWERRKVNGEAWTPVRLEIRATARVLLFRRLALHRIVQYFDFRKSPVSASSTFSGTR
jgi:hypothetical protein